MKTETRTNFVSLLAVVRNIKLKIILDNGERCDIMFK